MQVFDPMKAMNAFASGAQLGEGIRQRQTQAGLAPMVARGDYQAAAQFAGERGDLQSAELYRKQYADQIAQMDERTKAKAAQRADTLARIGTGLLKFPYEQRKAELMKSLPMLQTMGIDPDMIAQFDPTDQAIDSVLAQALPLADLLKAQQPTTLAQGSVLVDPITGRQIAENPRVEEPGDRFEQFMTSDGRYMQRNRRTGQVSQIYAPRAEQPGFGVQFDEQGRVSYVGSGAGVGEAGRIPPGMVRVPDPSAPGGTRLVPEAGGPAAVEAEGRQRGRASIDYTFESMMDNYLQLQDMGAIRDVQASPLENISAYIQSSGLGREFGKATGAPAESLRETIEAIQPSIVQAIMSQPGMSARSMDSQKELEFFMKSITTPTADVWANFATLHALDLRFGSGNLMQRMLQSGRISSEDYSRIVRSPRVQSIGNEIDQEINRLFKTDAGMMGQGNMMTGPSDSDLPPGFVIIE